MRARQATSDLKIDRPQTYSSVCPVLCGLIPQTLCADNVAEVCRQRTGRSDIVGDGDPLDICILSERPISHGDILLRAVPIGGLRMIDHSEADDKIVAVLKDDPAFGSWTDMYQCPPSLLDRLRHYFLTYKEVPSESRGLVEITEVYGRVAAHDVIRRSQADYRARFGQLEHLLSSNPDDAQAAGLVNAPDIGKERDAGLARRSRAANRHGLLTLVGLCAVPLLQPGQPARCRGPG